MNIAQSAQPTRGALYIVWGDAIENTLQRSIASLRVHHPDIPIRVVRLDDNNTGLQQKCQMGSLTFFDTTLYLDADTIVLGNLDFAFEKAEQFGLACCICEAPWLRRYDVNEGDRIEYNTGVLFFTSRAAAVFNHWEQERISLPAASTWMTIDNKVRGLLFDDQAGFARAIAATQFNPFILPINYNLRPTFHRSLFLPLKIWHDYNEVPDALLKMNAACERNERAVTYVSFDDSFEVPTRPVCSVITPTNDSKTLREAYVSLVGQSLEDWEWIIVVNGELTAEALPDFFNDRRIRVLTVPEMYRDVKTAGNIGALKAFACSHALGDFIVELDHDDLLLPEALSTIRNAFNTHRDVGMVYSNRAAVRDDWSPYYFGEGYGWEYRSHWALGRDLVETVIPDPHPANLSRIWYAPDHVRAWRATTYRELGGHDVTLELADDHDLSCRFYLGSKLLHLDQCLYIYKIHDNNNWLQNVDKIQTLMWRNHDRHLLPMYQRWSNEHNLLKIEAGCNQSALKCATSISDFLSVDSKNAAIENDLTGRWPFRDDSIGVIRAENGKWASLPDTINTMNEAWRVLAHGGLLTVEVPSTDGRGAFCDPTHLSHWNELSFRYCTDANAQAFVKPRAIARFQTLRIRTYFPSKWHQQQNISYVQAHLVALKNDSLRFHGDVSI